MVGYDCRVHEGGWSCEALIGWHSHRVWPECEWLLLPFALPGFGDSFWGGMGCVRLCVWRREHWSLWEKAGKKKGKGGQEDREKEREQELVKRGREGASGSEAGLPLKHCSLSFASLRKLSFSSRCLSLLLAASSLAAWPWPWWTPWSPCPPREEERKRCSGGGRREEGTTAHFASLMRVWKLINHHQHRGGRAERGSGLE